MADNTVYGLEVGGLGKSGGKGKTPPTLCCKLANFKRCSASEGSAPGGMGGKKGKGRWCGGAGSEW